jgi:hypothetical protein
MNFVVNTELHDNEHFFISRSADPSISGFIPHKRGLPGAARDYFTISLWNSPVQTLQAWGEPPTKKMYTQTHPKEQLLFTGPRPILKYTPIW